MKKHWKQNSTTEFKQFQSNLFVMKPNDYFRIKSEIAKLLSSTPSSPRMFQFQNLKSKKIVSRILHLKNFLRPRSSPFQNKQLYNWGSNFPNAIKPNLPSGRFSWQANVISKEKGSKKGAGLFSTLTSQMFTPFTILSA